MNFSLSERKLEIEKLLEALKTKRDKSIAFYAEYIADDYNLLSTDKSIKEIEKEIFNLETQLIIINEIISLDKKNK